MRLIGLLHWVQIQVILFLLSLQHHLHHLRPQRLRLLAADLEREREKIKMETLSATSTTSTKKRCRKKGLGEVSPEGRVDVLAYNAAKKALAHIEEKAKVNGLVEHLLPLIEDTIKECLPRTRIKAPKELEAIINVFRANRGSRLVG